MHRWLHWLIVISMSRWQFIHMHFSSDKLQIFSQTEIDIMQNIYAFMWYKCGDMERILHLIGICGEDEDRLSCIYTSINIHNFWAIHILIISISLLLVNFSHQPKLAIFQWRLCDSKSSQVSWALRILTRFNNAVIWMVSILSQISDSTHFDHSKSTNQNCYHRPYYIPTLWQNRVCFLHRLFFFCLLERNNL